MLWNIPQTKKHGEFLNHQHGSDQTDSNHLGGNGQEVRPLSAGVLRIHFILDSILSSQKTHQIVSDISDPINQDGKIVKSEENARTSCYLGFVKDIGYLIYNIFDKPSQQTINHVRKDLIKVTLDPRINLIVKPKTGEGGPQGEGQPGGQGVATPTPPQQQPSQAFPGPPSKAVTPKQLQGGAKVEKAPTGQEAPKANSKKSEPAPNVDTQTKPAQVKGKTTLNEKSTLNEKPSQVDKIQALFTPDPGMNFYNSQVADNESDTGMVIDTEDEKEEAAKGKNCKAPPLQNDVSSEEDEPENEDTDVVEDLIQSNREAEDKAAELLAELEATRANMRLLAKSKGIKPAELADYLLAVGLNLHQSQHLSVGLNLYLNQPLNLIGSLRYRLERPNQGRRNGLRSRGTNEKK